MKLGSPRLMVRQAHHEPVPRPFVLRLSKGERDVFLSRNIVEAKNLRFFGRSASSE